MKATLALSSLLFLAITFFSCAKDSTSADQPVNSLNASVNGAAFISGAQSTTQQGPNMDNAVRSGSQLTFTGRGLNNDYITLAINNYGDTLGTYRITAAGIMAVGAYNTGVTGASDIIASTGTTSITLVDKTFYKSGYLIKGTFSFTAGTYNITNGTFQVYLPH